MHEKLVIVPRKITQGRKIMTTFWFVLACILLLFSTFLSPFLFFIPAILVTIVWIWQAFFSKVEYEYTYYDGDLVLAKIKNKARRKKLADISMEDVILVAPKGDRAIYKYENDKSIKCKKLLSGQADAKVYGIVVKGEKTTIRYEFEPDEEFIDAMRVKYPHTVIK